MLNTLRKPHIAFWVLLAAFAAVLGVGGASTFAQTIVTIDYSTGGTGGTFPDTLLRTEIDNPSNNGNIIELKGGGSATTILVTAPFEITQNITIRSTDNEAILTAQGTTNVLFNVAAGVTLTLERINLDGSNQARGIVAAAGSNVTFRDATSINAMSGANGAAFSVAGATLTIEDTNFSSNIGTDGIIFVSGASTLTLRDTAFVSNGTSGTANRGVVTITGTGNSLIERSRFLGTNTATAGNVYHSSTGTLNLRNSAVAVQNGLGSVGVTVAAGTLQASYVSISGSGGKSITNAGGTIIVKNSILYSYGTASPCSGTLSLLGTNFIQTDGSCTLGGAGINVSADPKLNPANFTLSNDSPAINRGESGSCTDQNGNSLTPDFNNVARPQDANCDVGASEVGVNSVTPPEVVLSPATTTVTEGGTGSIVTFTLNIFPISPVTVNITDNDPDCDISGTSVTLNSTNWRTGTTLTVTPVNDTLPEGDHTCTLVTLNAVSGDALYSGRAIPDLVFTVIDNDLSANPTVSVDLSQFLARRTSPTPVTSAGTSTSIQEGELTGRSVFLTLDTPPTSPRNVTLRFTDTANGLGKRECTFQQGLDVYETSIALNADNWDALDALRQQVIIFAQDDGETETAVSTGNPGASPCRLEVLDNGTLESTYEIDTAIDLAQQILVQSFTPSLQESFTSSGSINYKTLRSILTAGESYRVTLISSNTRCQVSPSTFILDSANTGQTTVTVSLTSDGGAQSPAQTCTITGTVTAANPTPATAVTVATVNISVLADPLADSNLLLTGASDTSLNEGESTTFTIALENTVTTPVTVIVKEQARNPSTPQQCSVLALPSSDSSNPISATASMDGRTTQTFQVTAIDDLVADGTPHNCTIGIYKKTSTEVLVSSFVVTINDNDVNKVYLDPNPPVGQNFIFAEAKTFTYSFTFDPVSNVNIVFTAETPSTCTAVGSSIAFSTTVRTATISVLPSSATAGQCRIKAVLDTNLAVIADEDADIPDIVGQVGPRVTDPPSSVTTTATVTTPVATSAVVNAAATAAAIPATLSPDLPPPNSLRVIEEVDYLPIRTGPYLGATISNFALRNENPAEADSPLNFYVILAKSLDENGETIWYQVRVNGTIGWISSVSVTANIDNEALPVAGSIFDQIENAPDLGISGYIVRERLVYRRPSRRAAQIGSVGAGSTVSIIGRTREHPYDDWYQVRFAGGTGWIESEQRREADPAVSVNPDNIRQVPVR